MAIQLRNGRLTAEISPLGAEITSLRAAAIGEFIWQASDDRWRRQSPILFPVIGRYKAGMVRIGAEALDLPPHGFAPGSEFSLEDQTDTSCTLALDSSAATLPIYPYAFSLQVRHELTDTALVTSIRLTNPSDRQTLPFMLGGHPGFCWPLPQAGAREEHRIAFETPERDQTEVLTSDADPDLGRYRFDGQHMQPSAMNFDSFTHLIPHAKSRAVSFGTPAINLTLHHQGFAHLAIWSRGQAPFLCLEPWSNLPIDVDHPQDLADIADMNRLAPGQSADFIMRIEPGGSAFHAAPQSSAPSTP